MTNAMEDIRRVLRENGIACRAAGDGENAYIEASIHGMNSADFAVSFIHGTALEDAYPILMDELD